jgi:hypothetical protein
MHQGVEELNATMMFWRRLIDKILDNGSRGPQAG